MTFSASCSGTNSRSIWKAFSPCAAAIPLPRACAFLCTKGSPERLRANAAREVPGLDLAAGYVPARELGGDFYDFLPYGKGRLGFALGDVSGKGTAAALYGSLAIGMLREHVVTHLCPPAEMLATLNHRLYNTRFDSRFIAMLFATYDAPSRSLTLSNAGGPYPLLVRKGQVQAIRLEGVPLGLIPDTQYDETP